MQDLLRDNYKRVVKGNKEADELANSQNPPVIDINPGDINLLRVRLLNSSGNQ